MTRSSTRTGPTGLCTAEEAWQRILPHLFAGAPESVPRTAASGRVLSTALAATTDVPAADVSAMDGYALGGPVEPGTRLAVAGTAAAGDSPGRRLPSGAAVAIMTGAPVPAGADRVAPVEATDGGDRTVTIHQPPSFGAHIRHHGEVVRTGGGLLAAATEVSPQALSLLASQGIAEVAVISRPRVAFLSTGSEVVAADQTPPPGHLRDSHTEFLAAACDRLQVQFSPLGIAPDDPDGLEALLEAGLDADLLLISGGVSKGAFDYVCAVVDRRGWERLLHGVAIQPGKPLLVARRESGLVFGLPGNPASVMCGFWLFVQPALRIMAGHRDGFWTGSRLAILDAPLPAGKARDQFLPALLRLVAGSLHAEPLVPRGSHDLATWARAQALVRVRRDVAPQSAGSACEVLPL